MRLSFEDEANEEIACGREYTPIPESVLADRHRILLTEGLLACPP
jgi:hypothetical protein